MHCLSFLKKNPPQKKMNDVFVVRHGERADFPTVSQQSVDYEYEYDPPLTPFGLTQATKTGEFIRDEYRHQNADFIIYSSPFLRCLQTASNIAKQLDTTQVTIEDGFCEYLSSYWYNEDPLPILTIRKNAEDDNLANKFGLVNIIDGKSIDHPNYPENDVYGKYLNNFETYTNTHTKCQPANEQKQVLIIVTHGYGVHGVAMSHMGTEMENRIVDFCGLNWYQWNLQKKQWKYLRGADDSHLDGLSP